jgi:hypothetical protein
MAHTFIFFSLLPTELRLKVWNHACSLFPRVIEAAPQILNSVYPEQYRRWRAMASTILTLLQVNHEARYELLPRYSAPFSLRKLNPYHPAFLLINHEIDTLYFRVGEMSLFRREMFFQDLFEDEGVDLRNNLQSLAGNEKFWHIMIPQALGNPNPCFRDFDNFTKLSKVVVVSYLEQRLDDSDGAPGLARLEESALRGAYERRYEPWLNNGFNSIPRNIPIIVKQCKEVAKLVLASAL